MRGSTINAIVAVTTCLIVCAIVFGLFSSSGPANGLISSDLSFLVFPLIGFSIFVLGARLARIYVPGIEGKSLSNILIGAAFVFVSYMLLPETEQVTEPTYVAQFSEIRGWVALVIIGITVHNLVPWFTVATRTRVYQPAIRCLGHLLIGFAIYRSLQHFTDFWSHSDDVGRVVMAGFIAIILGHLAWYGRKSRFVIVRDSLRWVSGSQFRNLLIGIFVASYFIFIRPKLLEKTDYTPLIEWAALSFVVWILIFLVKSRLESKYSMHTTTPAWKKHKQRLERKVGFNFMSVVGCQTDFVKTGRRERLLEYLQSLLTNARISEDQVRDILAPLVSYKDVKAPWYTFGFREKHTQQRNLKARKNTLKAVISKVTDHFGKPIERVEVRT